MPSRQLDDMGIYRLNPARLKSVDLARNLGDCWGIWCGFTLGQTYIRSSGTTGRRREAQMGLVWRRQLHTLEYPGNKLRIQITGILDQFIRNSWNLIWQKVPGQELPVSIGKVCGFLNVKKRNDDFP